MGKSMSTLVIQPSFRAVGQTQAKWQTFLKKLKIRDKCIVHPSLTTIHLSLIFRFFKCLRFRMCLSYALKLRRVTNLDILFLTMGFICLSDKEKEILIVKMVGIKRIDRQ